MAVYTDLNAKDIELILSNYNLELIEYHKIKNGILNTNYFIKTDRGKFVLRVFEGGRKFEEENLELDFLLDLNSVLPCCLPLKTVTGENYVVCNDKMIALFHFIHGNPIKRVDEEVIKEIAKYIGMLHNYSVNKKLNRKSRIDMDFYYNNIDFENNNIPEDDKKKILSAYEKVKHIDFSELPSGIIHNDIFPDNVFIDNNKIVGILDFNESQTGPFIMDLAIIINYWIRINRFPKEKEDRFIKLLLDEYQKERPLTKEEMELLKYANLKMAVTFILLRLYKFNYENLNDILIEEKNYTQLMPLLEK